MNPSLINLVQFIGDYGEGQGVLPRYNWLVEFQTAFNSDQSSEDLITFDNIAKAIGDVNARKYLLIRLGRHTYKVMIMPSMRLAKRMGNTFLSAMPIAQPAIRVISSLMNHFNASAIPQIGVGKASGVNESDDSGCYLETNNAADYYTFGTPSLLNVEVICSYRYYGAYDTLEGIVRNPKTRLQPPSTTTTLHWNHLYPPPTFSKILEMFWRNSGIIASKVGRVSPASL